LRDRRMVIRCATRAGRMTAIASLCLLAVQVHAQESTVVPGARSSTAGFEDRLPPEPLSPWSAVEAEIERLVVRGDLPFEARSFRPIDRAELAAWLLASRPASASPSTRPEIAPSRALLLALLRWDLAWVAREPVAAAAAGSPDPLAASRPGTLLRIGAGDRLLTLSPYLRAMPRFATGREVAWTDSTRLGFRATFFGGRSLVIESGFYAAEVERGRSFADPLVAGTDLILHADELTLSARLGALRLRLGRDRHHWGPGASGTLLLAESARPLDFVEYQIRLGERLRFLALTAITDRHAALGAPGSNPGANRYLAAHRLLWTITPDFALGLSEGARYQAAQPGLLYLAGFVPFTLVERLQMYDEPSDSTENFLRNNVLWSVDLAWRARPDLLLYTELLADDIATQSSSTPTRGGFQLGLTYAPRWRGWDWTLGAEYTRISDFTYSVYYQDLCRCDWEDGGEPLGFPLGPDSEVALLRAALKPRPALDLGVSIQHARRGDGAIGRPWRLPDPGCDPARDDCGDANAWSFDRPRRSWTLAVESRYRPVPLVWMGLRVEHLARKEPRIAGGAATNDWESETLLRWMVSAGQ